MLGEAGHQLAQSIRSWGDDLALQKLWLHNCSLTEAASLELVQSLSTCRHLIELDLEGNNLGESEYQLAQSIQSWGHNPQLRIFRVPNCLISAKSSDNVLKSLSRCRLLTELALSENPLGEAAHQLTQSIRSWGGESSLRELYLFNCSLSEQASTKLLQVLSTCRHLTHLSLGRNMLGLAGNNLAQYIRSQEHFSQLQVLLLKHCMIPVDIWHRLFQALSLCEKLTMLDVSENDLGEAGTQFAQTIRSWGDGSKLKGLYMAQCSMPVPVWTEVLQSLSACKNLNVFDAPKEVLEEAENLPAFITLPSPDPPVTESLLEKESAKVIYSCEIVLNLILI